MYTLLYAVYHYFFMSSLQLSKIKTFSLATDFKAQAEPLAASSKLSVSKITRNLTELEDQAIPVAFWAYFQGTVRLDSHLSSET